MRTKPKKNQRLIIFYKLGLGVSCYLHLERVLLKTTRKGGEIRPVLFDRLAICYAHLQMAFWSEWVLEMLKCFSYFQLFTKERGRQLASITITIPLCVTTKLSHSFARQMEPAYNMGIELFPFLPPPPARSVGKQINGWGCQGLHVPQLIPPSPTTPNSSVRPHRCLRNTLPLADSVTAGPASHAAGRASRPSGSSMVRSCLI